ncbi:MULTISPECIES: YhfT family protein [unclassified Streptomyces]|uniref:YhfT family protein n=1 Tax=Streptomyces flavovirens TaxID=52258 RepID=A0ABV8N2G9_9ACTN|nr:MULTISPECIES: YhfT family protein [unclassified Streptomyces]MYR68421.1 permease [Streptomyces sp. SID4939]MYS02125.1 permease [Streptomyces sp. SID4940]MYT66776.1 permease [Streptomyces sp. SID8357]MYT83697.1 permease [Streptomyces sp. SID8360]MYU34410.1 permease [Streptomyces sp. SID8358]MYW35572.1 permease [Streptomyces sp. SID1]MYX72639.1 permease [Streptomyces sp. SID3915]HBF80068.1 permease [Streptomyces sp.]
MSTTLAAGAGLDFTLAQQLTVIALCALTAYISHMALAVFNDGVRPFMLDFIQGRTTRSATTAVSFGLSAGFIFGLGAPMALSTGVLNPWLVFLPTDILGILAPKKWLAPILGGAWGAVVVFGLNGANNVAHDLPVDFLTAMQQMSTPILFLFSLFPVLAITKQFGRRWGGVAGVLELALVVMTMKLWPNMFAGALAMAAGVLMLIGLAVSKDVRQRRADRAANVEEVVLEDDPMASLFSASAARLRRYLPLFMVLGAGVCVLAQMHIFGGGEATSFLIAKGQYSEAAQVDFYRVFGFIPLIATTALASGAYGIAGFTLVYPIGYLMPNPFLAAVVGALVFAVEVLALSWIGRVLGKLPSVRDSSEHLRSAIGDTLQLAILFGSLMAANAMGGGLGILVVGGLYLLNEAMGRPVVKMAAAPAAVIVGGILLNLLYWLDLFTPIKG